MSDRPILYSFRRCPYAIRARMTLLYAGVSVELREVVLKNKPAAMLEASPKGTVPVLVLPRGGVIDESLEIMHWALAQRDPNHWLDDPQDIRRRWIEHNDGEFKGWLDKYKYADRHPEHPAHWYRDRCETFLQEIEAALRERAWLSGDRLGFIDVAVFPFLRQFAAVAPPWMERSPYRALRTWLDRLLTSSLFTHVMTKHAPWEVGQAPLIFPPPDTLAVAASALSAQKPTVLV